MKKGFVILALAFAFRGTAQTGEGKNMAKIDLSAFAFKGFNIQYERQVSSRVTVALSYGAIPMSSLSYKSYIKKQVFIPEVDIEAFRLSTSVFTPEARYYFGKQGAFHGFYIAPYVRISSYKINGPVMYTNANNVQQQANFSGKLNAINGGLMIGSAWQISRRFYLDWWIVGAGYGTESGTFNAPLQLSPADQSSLQKTLNSISLNGITLTSQVNNNGAVVTTKGSIAGFRGLGINFGIRF